MIILKKKMHINTTLLYTVTSKMTKDIFIVMNSMPSWLLKTRLGIWLQVTKMAELTKQKKISLAIIGFVNTCSEKYMFFAKLTFLKALIWGENLVYQHM